MLQVSKPICPKFTLRGYASTCSGVYGTSKIENCSNKSKLIRDSRLPKNCKATAGYVMFMPNSIAIKPMKAN